MKPITPEGQENLAKLAAGIRGMAGAIGQMIPVTEAAAANIAEVTKARGARTMPARNSHQSSATGHAEP